MIITVCFARPSRFPQCLNALNRNFPNNIVGPDGFFREKENISGGIGNPPARVELPVPAQVRINGLRINSPRKYFHKLVEKMQF